MPATTTPLPERASTLQAGDLNFEGGWPTTRLSTGVPPVFDHMERGLFIAASGMLAELERQQRIASDLANVSTAGYKRDRVSQQGFGELLLTNQATGQTVGRLGTGPSIIRIETDLTQATLRDTGDPLNVALQGEGAFAVQTPAGVQYTRDGQFTLDGAGRLVTSGGFPILDQSGGEIVLPGSGAIAIGADGTISRDTSVAGQIAVVTLTGVSKTTDGLLTGTPGPRPDATLVQQGQLETSSVNAAKTMVDMMTSLRAFEASQRAVRAIDQTLNRGIQAGSASGSGR